MQYKSLADVEGLEQLPRLRSCLLWGNSLTSCDALKGTTTLEKLYMSNNCITSLAPLEHLTNLKVLIVSGNPLPPAPPGVDMNKNVAIHRAQLVVLHAENDARAKNGGLPPQDEETALRLAGAFETLTQEGDYT